MKRKTTKEKRLLKSFGRFAAGLALLWGFVACSMDETDLTGGGGSACAGTKEINFRIDLPSGSPASKAVGESQENAITRMDVLAFKVDGSTETYEYTQPATLVSGTTWKLTAQVRDYPQRFVIVTGVEAEVAALTADPIADKNKATMLARLVVSQNGRWNTTSASDFRALPMWGESASQTITGGSSELGQVSMLRMLAGIDVELKSTALTNFEMTSVRLYNTNATGRVTPDAVKVSEGKATAPTIPSGATLITGPITYDQEKGDFSAGTVGEAMKGAIYTFETAAPVDGDQMKATCLVIGGKYNKTGNETFYRVDFLKADKTTFLDILRNHKYQVNITEVKGNGHSSPEEAFKSRSVNMVSEVLSWNEVGMNVITTDGQYTLAVDKDQYAFTREAKTGKETDNILNVWTDYTNSDTSKSGWTVEKYVDAADENQEVTWLELVPAKGDADATTETYIRVGENLGPSARSAKIILAAGRLRKPILVTQDITAMTYMFTPSQTTVNYGLLLDGTAEFTFSTNTDWVAELSGDLAPVGGMTTQGGAGLNQRFSYPMTLDESNEKRVTKSLVVTFSSPTGKFTPVTVTINGNVPYLKFFPEILSVSNLEAHIVNLDIDTNLDFSKLLANVTDNANGMIGTLIVNTNTGQLEVELGEAQQEARTGGVNITFENTQIIAYASLERIKNPYTSIDGRLVTEVFITTGTLVQNGSANTSCPAGFSIPRNEAEARWLAQNFGGSYTFIGAATRPDDYSQIIYVTATGGDWFWADNQRGTRCVKW